MGGALKRQRTDQEGGWLHKLGFKENRTVRNACQPGLPLYPAARWQPQELNLLEV